MNNDIIISALWDAEAKVWVAEALNLPGLVTEAANIELLQQKLSVMIPEIMELNEIESATDSVPFTLLARQSAIATRPPHA